VATPAFHIVFRRRARLALSGFSRRDFRGGPVATPAPKPHVESWRGHRGPPYSCLFPGNVILAANILPPTLVSSLRFL
jgi:hypothetical protein